MSDFIIGLPPTANPDIGGNVATPIGVLVPVAGRDGSGLQLAGVLSTYAELPTNLDPADSGVGYLVLADNRAYLWNGYQWPAEGAGAPLKGDKGDPGRGVVSISTTADGLRFTMTEAPTPVDVSVPALAAATAAASQATTAANDAVAAADIATAAAGSATTSAASATDATEDATAARDIAQAAASTATSKAASATNSATAAASDATSAGTHRTQAAASASAAAASAADASAARDATTTARDTAVSAASDANTAKIAAAASADDAQHWAESAAETVGSGIPNADVGIKGGIMLPGGTPGELGGTFEHPVVAGWSSKADVSAVNAKYTRPTDGIPRTDLESAVQASLGKADLSYTRPGVGIPKADLESAVQTSLGKADSAVQVDGSGKLPAAIIPAVALAEFLGAVGSQSAMLALTGQRGDWCTRTDTGTDWQVIAEPSTALANWRERTYPASPVSTVNGRTGAVTTAAVDITDSTTIGRSVLTAASASAARSSLGAGTSSLALGTAAGTAAAGDDARLSDPRTPLDGSVTNAKIAAGAAIALSKLATGYVSGADNSGPRTFTIWVGTEAQFMAIATKDTNTIYLRSA
ncbi:phage upper tail fiber protein [Nocardia sp. FBN12]|uniref:phage upper tail fiber protein n=1 Tax=Nocardia sp. FBN12 TaxID=3419766 RepID=UPI003D039DDE